MGNDFRFEELNEQGIDFKYWLLKIVTNWPLFLLFVGLALGVASLVNSFRQPEFEVTTSLLIKPDQSTLYELVPFQQSTLPGTNVLENEIGIIKSTSLLKRSIEKMPMVVEYFEKRNFLQHELIKDIPFSVHFDSISPSAYDVLFTATFNADSTIEINSDEFLEKLELNASNTSETAICCKGRFFEEMVAPNCKFRILPSATYQKWPGKSVYYFRILSKEKLTAKLSKFKVDNIKSSSILVLSLRHTNPTIAARFLNILSQEYLLKGVERDNLIAIRTIDFIDRQLVSIVDSLQSSESQLEDYRISNNAINLDFQAQQAFQRADNLQREKSLQAVKLRYLNYLKECLTRMTDNMSELIVPSTLDINDAVLNSLVLEMMQLNKERNELSLNSRKDNPYISSLEEQIQHTQSSLLETVKNIYEASELKIEDIDRQLAENELRINKLPQDQRMLLNIERNFQLNDEIYTFLLTKRSEMQIQKASNVPFNEVLDAAQAGSARLIAPNKRRNLASALLLGLLIPFLLIWIKDALNDKIHSVDDIKQLTDIPVIATIIVDEQPNAVERDIRDLVLESFRTLVAGLKFTLPEQEASALMVTSAIPAEGKSYVSMRLASMYASFSKKVCLLDMDLRKARLSKNLGLQPNEGISTYLSKQSQLDTIITQSEYGFDVLPVGPIPPNASILLASKMVGKLFNQLRKNYDLIIVDTAPVAVVSDAQYLYPMIDSVLFVSRFNVTPKPLLEKVFEDLKRKNVDTKHNIIINAVPALRRNYGYQYGYGYTYNYNYNQPERTNILKKWLNKA